MKLDHQFFKYKEKIRMAVNEKKPQQKSSGRRKKSAEFITELDQYLFGQGTPIGREKKTCQAESWQVILVYVRL